MTSSNVYVVNSLLLFGYQVFLWPLLLAKCDKHYVVFMIQMKSSIKVIKDRQPKSESLINALK